MEIQLAEIPYMEQQYAELLFMEIQLAEIPYLEIQYAEIL